jgi:hypothetical protein
MIRLPYDVAYYGGRKGEKCTHDITVLQNGIHTSKQDTHGYCGF